MYDPIIIQKLGQIRHQEILEQAARDRLFAEYGASLSLKARISQLSRSLLARMTPTPIVSDTKFITSEHPVARGM